MTAFITVGEYDAPEWEVCGCDYHCWVRAVVEADAPVLEGVAA